MLRNWQEECHLELPALTYKDYDRRLKEQLVKWPEQWNHQIQDNKRTSNPERYNQGKQWAGFNMGPESRSIQFVVDRGSQYSRFETII